MRATGRGPGTCSTSARDTVDGYTKVLLHPSVRGTVLTGALIARQSYYSELVAGNPLMSALDPSSGLQGKEYAKDVEAASDRHLHMRATGVRGGGEVVEGLWRISLEAVDGWTLRAGTEDDRGPFARLLGNP